MLDYSYSDEQKLLRENIRKWGKEHLPEEKIAEAYKNRGIDSAIAKSWVDEGFGKLVRRNPLRSRHHGYCYRRALPHRW